MLDELRKHAQTSALLRSRILTKEAGLGRAAIRGAGRVGTWALAHPVKATVLGLGGLAAGGKAISTYRSFKPEVLRKQVGME